MWLHSIGYAHPTNFLDNKFLEGLDTGTNEEWIIDKIGIKTRVTSLNEEYIKASKNIDPSEARKIATHTTADLAETASLMALEKAGISKEKIELIIGNCCAPNKIVPGEAQVLADRLGINAKAYEVFSACPAFALHVDYLNNLKPETLPDYIMAASTSVMSQVVNYTDRTDPAIWGDGASSCIFSPRIPGKLKVVDTTFMADPTRCSAVVVDRYGHFHQDGRAVRDFSVRQTVRLIKNFEEKYNLDWSKDVFIGHQANATMLGQIINNRGIPPENHWSNVETIGNQAGASASIVLGMNWEKIKPGMRIVVAVVGAGLSWGSILFEAE